MRPVLPDVYFAESILSVAALPRRDGSRTARRGIASHEAAGGEQSGAGRAAAAADPVWFASYPPGVPANIDPDAYPSLHAMLLEACRNYAERPAFECLRARMSYAEWERDSRDFAAFLLEEAKCRPGDRVAIMLPNMLAYPVDVPRHAARRADGRQRQSALHAARAASSSSRIPAPWSSSSWRISPTSSQTIIAETQIRHVVVARLGDFVPTLKRWAFNLANSYIKHAVPAWHFETFTMLQDACNRPPSERYADADAAGDCGWRCCNIPAARPAWPKARC